jgi:hypothetical protein
LAGKRESLALPVDLFLCQLIVVLPPRRVCPRFGFRLAG